jgi:hypothetical protein
MNAVELKKTEMKRKIAGERERMLAGFQERVEALDRREKALLLTAEVEVEIDVVVAKIKEATALNDKKEIEALNEQLDELNITRSQLYRSNTTVAYK